MRLFAILFFIYSTMGTAYAQSLLFESSRKKITLLEIYSSEGCSSCPPADRWASGLKEDSGLWTNFVPVIFHVDYWDRLGWKDSFASAQYTERQSQYVTSWGESTLYTPGFVLNGKPWDGWRQMRTVPLSTDASGILRVEAEGSYRYRVRFEPPPGIFEKLETHATLLGFDIQSDVRKGENAGRILKHDFVVLDYKRALLNNNTSTALLEFDGTKFRNLKLGLAIWVTREKNPEPIQAVGGYLAS